MPQFDIISAWLSRTVLTLAILYTVVGGAYVAVSSHYPLLVRVLTPLTIVVTLAYGWWGSRRRRSAD